MWRLIIWAAAVFPLGAGCSAENGVALEADAEEPTPSVAEGGTEFSANSVRVDIRPVVDPGTGQGQAPRALPESVYPINLIRDEVSLSAVQLRAPIALSGEVEAFRVNPFVSALLPGALELIDGTLFINRENSVQAYAATISKGQFSTWVLPNRPLGEATKKTPDSGAFRDDAYRMTVVPADAAFPLWSQDLVVDGQSGSADRSVELPVGAPIYGQVTRDNADNTERIPLPDARIHLIDSAGVRSATTLTDSEGRYLLRAQPGMAYTVVCEGRGGRAGPDLVRDEHRGYRHRGCEGRLSVSHEPWAWNRFWPSHHRTAGRIRTRQRGAIRGPGARWVPKPGRHCDLELGGLGLPRRQLYRAGPPRTVSGGGRAPGRRGDVERAHSGAWAISSSSRRRQRRVLAGRARRDHAPAHGRHLHPGGRSIRGGRVRRLRGLHGGRFR